MRRTPFTNKDPNSEEARQAQQIAIHANLVLDAAYLIVKRFPTDGFPPFTTLEKYHLALKALAVVNTSVDEKGPYAVLD